MGYKDSTDARFLFKGQIVTDDTIDDSADIDASKLAATDSTHIFVATNGSDTGTGSIVRPYATLTKAFSVLTSARKTIFVMPGDYAEAATLTWPNIDGVRISGMDSQGNVVISAVRHISNKHKSNRQYSRSVYRKRLYRTHRASRVTNR